jgi:hypothetical protein
MTDIDQEILLNVVIILFDVTKKEKRFLFRHEDTFAYSSSRAVINISLETGWQCSGFVLIFSNQDSDSNSCSF